MIEIFHRIIYAMLIKTMSSHQKNWDEVLPHILADYRAYLRQTTGFSPNFLMFGQETRTPLDLVYGRSSGSESITATYVDCVQTLLEHRETAYQMVREQLKASAERRRRTFELRVRPADFKVGDNVLYFTPRRRQERTSKWSRIYTGPFVVRKQCGPMNYVIGKSGGSRLFTYTSMN